MLPGSTKAAPELTLTYQCSPELACAKYWVHNVSNIRITRAFYSVIRKGKGFSETTLHRGTIVLMCMPKLLGAMWLIALKPLLSHLILYYSIHVPGWLQKWLNLITAPGSVSNEPGSVTWLATKYLKTVSWRNHTEKLTILCPQNISLGPKINIPSSYFTILMLNCLVNTLKLGWICQVHLGFGLSASAQAPDKPALAWVACPGILHRS